jgi:hypothetical protein
MGRIRKTLEAELEQVLVNFPNLVHPALARMGKGRLGDVNVYLRQQTKGNGRIDLAFVTGSEVHLIELKRNWINENTVRQWVSYYEQIKTYYVGHQFHGYLAGKQCLNADQLVAMVQDAPMKILLFGEHIPIWSQIKGCTHCGFGMSLDDSVCPRCGKS